MHARFQYYAVPTNRGSFIGAWGSFRVVLGLIQGKFRDPHKNYMVVSITGGRLQVVARLLLRMTVESGARVGSREGRVGSKRKRESGQGRRE